MSLRRAPHPHPHPLPVADTARDRPTSLQYVGGLVGDVFLRQMKE